jgi:hypothetical protein
MKTVRIGFDVINDKTTTPEGDELLYVVQALQTRLHFRGFDWRNPINFAVDERTRELVFTQN